MKHLRTISTLFVFLALTLATLPATSVSAAGTCYVDADAVGANDGTSWADAYTNLQSALGDSPCTEVWVAAGVYKPTAGTDRAATFQLKDGVGVYGGFTGTETTREERDWEINITVLSGDIDGNDITDPTGVVTDPANIIGANSYHVVISSSVTETAVLNGFFITAGLANDPYDEECNGLNCGGGMFNDNSSPTLTNITFSGNSAEHMGGGMYNDNSSPTLNTVTFSSNTSVAGDGGGMFNSDSSPALTNVAFYDNWAHLFGGGTGNQPNNHSTLMNVTFSGNQATLGGGMSNRDSSNPTLSNVTFNGNLGYDSGGGMYNFNQSSPMLTDVVFSGNISGTGGGMNNYVGCSPTLTNVTFSDNQANSGGGMYNNTSAVALTQVLFSGNQGVNGGAMHNFQSSVTMTNITIAGNVATGEGGGIYNDGSGYFIQDNIMVLTQVLFSGNKGVNGGAMHNFQSSVTMTNINMAGNLATGQGGGIYNDGSDPYIQNTLIWGNQSGSGGDNLFNSGSSGPIIRYSLVGGCNPGGAWNSLCGTDGGNNLADTDPLFVAPEPASSAPTTAGDYRLQDASPAINMGDNAADLGGTGPLTATIQTITQDLDSNPRFVRVFVDLGAYENQTFLCPAGGILYVDQAASGPQTGDSWADALLTLQDALQVSEACEIWVAEGVYYPDEGGSQADNDRTATFQLKDGVGVYGGFAGTETARDQRNPATNITILSGDLNGDDNSNVQWDEPTRADNSSNIVIGATGATLDGFTITAGNANGTDNKYDGGGMYNMSSSPTLANITFSNNSAKYYGGGMYNEGSSPTLTNVTFSGNSANNSGGGVYNHTGNPTLTNATFSGNSAIYGGGMHNVGSSPILTNVTFNSNSAQFAGGMYTESGSPMLTNATFTGNSAVTDGGGMFNHTSNPTLTNVTFSGNSAQIGGGMLNYASSDPLLTNVTFSNNHATDGGGMANRYSSNPQIRNTIFWGNTASWLGAQIFNDTGGTSNVADSVVQDGCPAGNTCTNIITTDPMLGALGDYGGFTQTIPLQANSSAIDTGNDGVGVCPATDQRGIARPQGAHCDIGAFELVDTTAPDTSIDSKTPAVTPTNSTSISFTFSGTDADSGIRSFECNLDGDSFTACTSPKSYTSLAEDAHTFQIRAINYLGMIDPSPASYTWTVDLTAPVITVPTDIPGVEATSPTGAIVNYPAATATDETAPANPVVTCSPVSGSTFPLGTTTVNCSATDTAGNVGMNSFTITVVDTTDPILTVPADMTVGATSAAGAAVTFNATATDVVDPNPVVACAPASGSTFALGLNTVDCTATDDMGNVANDSFTITVVYNLFLPLILR